MPQKHTEWSVYFITLFRALNMEQKTTKKITGKLLIAAVTLIIVLGIGVFFWLRSIAYETTDNAQLDCNIIPVKSIIASYVKSINFNDNDIVKKGQILIVFDTVEIKAKVNEAYASLQIAQAKLAVAKHKASASDNNAAAGVLTADSYQQSILSAKASLNKAQSSFDRISNLLKIKGATQEQYETAYANLSIAKADYAKALSIQKSSSSTSLELKSLAKSDANQIVQAEAQVAQCEAELVLAKRQLEYTVVRSPCNGIVSKRAVQEGQYVFAGQNLFALVDNENLWVTANVKETQLRNIKPGQIVNIEVDAYPNINLTGKVESFSGATGAKYSLLPPDNATGNFIKITQRVPVKISLIKLQPEEAKLLYPGMSVFAKIRTN